jgi:sugar phosphate isomerase/epimerase
MSTRRPLGPDDLVLSHFSLGRRVELQDRVEAAASAGFEGIGWYVADYVAHLERGWTDQRILQLLDDHGLVLHEVDALPLDRLGLVDAAIHMVGAFGARNLQVQGDRPGSADHAAAEIGRIADRIAPFDGVVAIEFLGSNNITTAADALDLALRSERPNVGVQVDIWHHVRGACDWEMLASLPLERIVSVQLDDGPIAPVDPDYLVDTIHHRCVPGEGEFDIERFLGIVHPPGSRLPISLEIIDDDLLALPPRVAAQRMARSMRPGADADQG